MNKILIYTSILFLAVLSGLIYSLYKRAKNIKFVLVDVIFKVGGSNPLQVIINVSNIPFNVKLKGVTIEVYKDNKLLVKSVKSKYKLLKGTNELIVPLVTNSVDAWAILQMLTGENKTGISTTVNFALFGKQFKLDVPIKTSK